MFSPLSASSSLYFESSFPALFLEFVYLMLLIAALCYLDLACCALFPGFIRLISRLNPFVQTFYKLTAFLIKTLSPALLPLVITHAHTWSQLLRIHACFNMIKIVCITHTHALKLSHCTVIALFHRSNFVTVSWCSWYLAVEMSTLIEPDLLESVCLLRFLYPHQFDVVQIAGHRHHEPRLSVP